MVRWLWGIGIVGISLVLLGALPGCNEPGGGGGGNTVAPNASALIGTWEYDNAEEAIHDAITFAANGTLTWTSTYEEETDSESGTYSVDGHALTMTMSESGVDEGEPYSWSESITSNFHIDNHRLCALDCLPFVREGDTFTAMFEEEEEDSYADEGEMFAESIAEQEQYTIRLLASGQCEVAIEYSWHYMETYGEEEPYIEQDSDGVTSVTCTFTQSDNSYIVTGTFPPEEDEDVSFTFTLVKFGTAWVDQDSLESIYTQPND